jgi:hypothetical protein
MRHLSGKKSDRTRLDRRDCREGNSPGISPISANLSQGPDSPLFGGKETIGKMLTGSDSFRMEIIGARSGQFSVQPAISRK